MNVEDLTVFILSHKSPNKCETLDALIKCNYKGKWYILIDDEDDFINEYKVKYGDNLVIYHKEDYKRNVDLGYSVMNLASYAHSIFARNALEDIAKSMGLKHYIVSDDDVYVARSYMDAPDIDGMIFIDSDRELISGEIVRVVITDSDVYDLEARLIY